MTGRVIPKQIAVAESNTPTGTDVTVVVLGEDDNIYYQKISSTQQASDPFAGLWRVLPPIYISEEIPLPPDFDNNVVLTRIRQFNTET